MAGTLRAPMQRSPNVQLAWLPLAMFPASAQTMGWQWVFLVLVPGPFLVRWRSAG